MTEKAPMGKKAKNVGYPRNFLDSCKVRQDVTTCAFCALVMTSMGVFFIVASLLVLRVMGFPFPLFW